MPAESPTPPVKGAPRRIRGLDAEQRREQRKQSILDAALDLFASRGYPDTSVELICQTAFVSTKSFYQNFGDREDCYLALYNRTATEFRAAMSAALAVPHVDESAQAEFIIEGFVDLLIADRRKALITFGHARAFSERIDEARHANRVWTADYIESLWQGRGLSIPPRRVTIAIVGGIFEVVIAELQAAEITADTRRGVIDDLLTFYTATRGGLPSA
ncbi:TetR/AcrR family transcriptional regulator [Gordonia sp. ABSL1-1]|uniref:TetR/AcrR family transcriptional regulator n=1 Tax=Gordonia sp. ABSL1-1 TaxID=3053923 RepID=UPI002574414D|nr:TetR/AcrR family transcriptional regulator [Gordonia sp. ABSL1-1]MDL9937608.1 TetR/AcrR family transcriptional regulator [Gordonia sp. ABSL1-1]